MITAGDFRNGMTIEYDGNICQVVEFQHVKPGKGAAFVKAKLRNLRTGSTVEKTFNTSIFPVSLGILPAFCRVPRYILSDQPLESCESISL